MFYFFSISGALYLISCICLDPKFIVLVAMSFNSCAFLDVAVRGMMYYRRALELQAFLDMATEDGTFSRAQTVPK
jgi:hypothetical protein